jgi:hypothetical protein
MELLASSLERQDLAEVVRFRTANWDVDEPGVATVHRRLWAPLWRRSRGRAIDRLLGPVDVVHVSGRATPPTRASALVIWVDDLRPLRDDSRGRHRVAQLRRAVDHGAQLVATSRIASLEVQRALGLSRENVVVVAPPVAWSREDAVAKHLVVNVTGLTDAFVRLAPALFEIAGRRSARVVVLASHEASARIRHSGLDVDLQPRRRAGEVLSVARVLVHLSDGARFPSVAVASMAAGVPVCATATELNREILGGAAEMADGTEATAFAAMVDDVWENESKRAVMTAAGRDRAADFAPDQAARAFADLYHIVLSRERPR